VLLSSFPSQSPPSCHFCLTFPPPDRSAQILITVHVQTRDNAIVNRLNKTKVEKEVDHESDRQERLRLEGRKKKVAVLERVRRSNLNPSLSSCSFLPRLRLLPTSIPPPYHPILNVIRPYSQKRDWKRERELTR
jgi:hypothetical protein